MRWEQGRSDVYAHLYGEMVGRGEVEGVEGVVRGEGEEWGVVFGGLEGWGGG